jgi:hypothetical protein
MVVFAQLLELFPNRDVPARVIQTNVQREFCYRTELLVKKDRAPVTEKADFFPHFGH